MTFYVIFLSLLFSFQLLFSSVGTLDNTFGTSGEVTTAIGTSGSNLNADCALQQDNKIVVVGNANPGFGVARYTEQGVLDTTFNSGGGTPGTVVTTAIGLAALAMGVAIQDDGKIVVCGTANSDGAIAVARYLSNGDLDTTFNTTGFVLTSIPSGTTHKCYGVAIDSSGNIVVCGSVVSSGQKGLVVRYTSAGVLDTSFNTTGYVLTVFNSGTAQLCTHIVIDSSNNIVVSGTVVISSLQQFLVARYTSAGALDTTFNTNGYVITTLSGGTVQSAYGLALDTSGNIIICGKATTSGTQKLAILKYSSVGVLDNTFGDSGSTLTTIGSSASGYKVAIQSSDKILVSGSNTDSMFIARYTADGVLDTTTFNASTGYTTVSLTTPGLTGLILQPNNGIVISALSVGSFTTARFVGDAAPQGCMNVDYNSAGATPGYISYPTDSTASNKPQVKSLQVLASNSVFVLTINTKSGSFNSHLVQVDSAGSTTSSNAIAQISIGRRGGADVIVDSHGRAVVVGTNGTPNGWIGRYVPTAGTPGSFAADSTFNGGSSLIQSSSPTTTGYSRVCEQASGNILAMGQNGTTGIVVAYNQNGTVNTNFGTSGVYSISTITLTDMIVDASDNIYVIGGVTSGNIKLYRILPDGSGLDTSYNTTGIIDTGFATASYQGAQLAAINGSGGTTLMTVQNSNKNFVFKRYTSAGAADSPASATIAQTTTLLDNPVITQYQIDSNNQPVFVGYDDNCFFTGRQAANLALDTTFAPYSSCPGILKTMYNNNNPTDSTTPKRVANCIGISPNGAIVFGGYENITSTTTVSVVGNVVGDTTPYYQLPRYPGAEIGQIDTSFGTSGALDLNASPASLPAGTAQPMYVLPNNKILVADTNGADTVLGQLTSAYVLDTGSFGAGTGKVTLTGLTNPKDILIDTSNNIYVVGDNGSNMMLFKITSAGVVVWSITSSSLTIGNIVLQQASGRIVVAGYNGTSGVIAGYNSATGALDTTFGVSGYYTTGVDAQVAAFAITSVDKIVFVYRAADATGVVNRLMSNGLVDTTFSFGTALTSVSANISSQAQIKLQLDVNGKIVVIARNSTGNFIARRYLATGANDVSTVTITLTNPSTSVFKDLLSLSNGTTLALGMNTNGNTVVMTKLTSAFAVDTNFNYSAGILQTAVSPMTNFYSLDVTADQGILVAGASTTPNPYFTRIFNDAVVTKVNQSTASLGTPGTIDTTFGTSGQVLLASLSGGGSLAGLTPQIVLPGVDGQYYIAFTSGALIRLTNAPILDTTFDTDGFASATPAGIQSLIIDGLNCLVAAGTTGGAGWVNRYNAGLGTLDTTFNTTIATSLSTLGCIAATTIAEQTLGRYIVAGTIAGGNGALFAFTNTGAIDTTFNSNGTFLVGGTTVSVFNTGVASGVYACAVDPYDRLIFAYKNGSAIDVIRLTSAGQLDTNFNSDGEFASALTGADNVTQVRIVVDAVGNIIVAAHTSSGISLRGLTTSGVSLYTQLNISTIITSTPVLTNLIATSDGNVLVSGYQATTSSMWVARVTVAGALDTAFGGGDGIMTFSFNGTATARFLGGTAIYGDGEIAMVGTETVSAVITPFLSMAYNSPYVTQVSQSPDSQAIGTNDTTLGASSTAAAALGVVFYATATATNGTAGQVARAIALQDDAHILVAVDGGASNGATTPSNIYLKMFNIDGVADTTFGTTGQRTVLTTYANQYVQDMVTFTTVAGVNKAILAGYTYNSTLPAANQYSSLLLQYNLDTHALDTDFGQFNGNAAGVAFGDGKQLFTLAQQSTGRIIAGGLSKDSSSLGLLLGYTAAGKLDTSFGNNGYQTVSGSTALYTQAIDTENRLVIAYMDGDTQVIVARFLADGSGLDTSFNSGNTINTLTSTYDVSSMRVAIDASNNVFVAAVADNRLSITIFSYDTTGAVLYTPLTTSLGSTLTAYTIAKLLVNSSGKVVVVGYDTNGGSSDTIVIIQALANLSALDSSFNAAGTPGYLKYGIDGSSIQVATDALIHPDGRIIIVGSEV